MPERGIKDSRELTCTSTGRKCEYDDAGPRQSKACGYNRTVPVPSSITDRLSESPEDNQLLHIFRLTTENELSRQFEPFCWAHLMLQLARIYPSVRQSICAVGALQRAYLRGEQRSHNCQDILEVVSTPLVLARYSMAVKSVSEDLCPSLQPVLICCALFTWLEFLSNNFETGLKHLRSGLEIIRNWSRKPESAGPKANLPTDPVDKSILQLFMRLQTHVTAHGYPHTDFHSTSSIKLSRNVATVKDRYLTMSGAWSLLDHIMLKVFRFVRHKEYIERSISHFDSSSPEFAELLRSRDSLLADLGQWQALFIRSSSTWSNNSQGANCGTLLLKSYHLMTNIILNTVLAESEVAYDDHVHDFSKLVSMAQQIIRSTTGPTFITLDVGVTPVLFFTCLKCRNTSIRNQALALLRLAPEREGIWHRDSIIAVSTLKITLEGNMKTRLYGERVLDAESRSQTARVKVFNETMKEIVIVEIPGLVSKLGDLL
ncbi:hypothetical protein F5Y10DRAFT_256709 [Nemania abortiva]|nr:hypothetical protein F5Y10DRAFT_256709 [Nemania abortiva]